MLKNSEYAVAKEQYQYKFFGRCVLKVLIIGGGMAGLTYGILSVKNGIETTICERNARVGKKISQTGNGKCNIGNVNVSESCFNQSQIAKCVCQSITSDEYVKFLESCGIFTFADSVGRMYPLSESASNVVDCLRTRFEKFGGKFLTETEITQVNRNAKGLWQADGCMGEFDKVILACGSGSGATSPNVFKIVPQKYFTVCVPSLVPLKIANMDKQLNGLRAKANVSLLCDGAKIADEKGEVQFKDYGVSGICIFNLSAQIARRSVLGEKHRYQLTLDLVPLLLHEKLSAVLQARISSGESADALFYGILHNKLAQSVVKRAANSLGGTSAKTLAETAKNFTLDVEKTLDFSMSQVTAGGISERFLNTKTLELPNGIVALGEILNVDGLCGGNNLYFAAASALYLFDESQRKLAYSNV